MRLKRGITILLGVMMMINSGNIVLAKNNETTQILREETLGTAEIDLTNKSKETVKKILKKMELNIIMRENIKN